MVEEVQGMSAKVPTVLFGSVDLESSRLLRERLRRDNVRILASGNTAEFLELARRSGPDVIVLEDTLESLGGGTLNRLPRAPCPTARVSPIMLPAPPPPPQEPPPPGPSF